LFGAHWSVAFSIGGPTAPPYHLASTLACMVFLCAIASGDTPAWARFGIAGALALAVTVVILVLGLIRLRYFGIVMSGDMKSATSYFPIIGYTARFLPWTVLLQVVLIAWLILRDNTRKSPGATTMPPQAPLTPSFGRRM
jgi:hypothetical protein